MEVHKVKHATSQPPKGDNGVTTPPNLFREVNDVIISRYFPEENLRSAIAYKPRPGELFVASYMKCGTTWMQTIVYGILNDGTPPQDSIDFMLRSPYIDLLGAEAADKMPGPGAIKTHLPFEKVPYSPDAKYICIARNPYDCCVSFYHHMLNAPFEPPQGGDFDAFLDMFIRGEVHYGCYFRHLLSWYERKNDANVMFVTFEELKRDTRGGVLKVADFIGVEYGEKLRNKPELLESVLRMAGIEAMRKIFDDDMPTLVSRLFLLPPGRGLQSLEIFKGMAWTVPPSRKKGGLIRKGLVGDYKNYFSSDQLTTMKDWIRTKTKNSDVMSLWENVELP
ncbi:sulfotransferase ssu-1 [Ixodes scapularis]|uniref:sulfotransferase ssu-1 n=1 Tax=Ixodes scapularis TaxID=6945 RepID=UPI001A9EB799|nr:sulfotransferase ssu-1 [Ixodes scapularis]